MAVFDAKRGEPDVLIFAVYRISVNGCPLSPPIARKLPFRFRPTSAVARLRPLRPIPASATVLESGRHAVEVFQATMWEAAVRSSIASASQAPGADVA